MNSRRFAVLSACVLTTITLAACGTSAADPGSDSGSDGAGSSDPDTLVFAAVPSEESSNLESSYAPLIALLEAETGKTIEFRQATDYAAVIEGQLAGEVQIAQYGPLSFVLAETQGADITPVAAQVDGPDEEPGYQSYGITTAGSGIESIEDFGGKTVCFVEPNSTSGYLYPSAGLLEAGIDLATGVEPVMAGSHDASVLEVAAGRCDAGFAFDSMVDSQLIEAGSIAEGDIVTVWKSEIIPGSPVALTNSLSPELREQLTELFQAEANSDALLAAGYCEGECLIGDEDSWGYAAVDSAFYDPIREVCEITKNESCTKE